MKSLVTLLMVVSAGAATLSSLCALLVYIAGNVWVVAPDDSSVPVNVYLMCVDIAVVIGLPLAALNFVYSVLLALFGFIAKSWIRAFISIAIALFSLMIWGFLLNAPTH